MPKRKQSSNSSNKNKKINSSKRVSGKKRPRRSFSAEPVLTKKQKCSSLDLSEDFQKIKDLNFWSVGSVPILARVVSIGEPVKIKTGIVLNVIIGDSDEDDSIISFSVRDDLATSIFAKFKSGDIIKINNWKCTQKQYNRLPHSYELKANTMTTVEKIKKKINHIPVVIVPKLVSKIKEI